MEYEVKITPYALRQMQEIVRYISATLRSPENATCWLDTLAQIGYTYYRGANIG